MEAREIYRVWRGQKGMGGGKGGHLGSGGKATVSIFEIVSLYCFYHPED